MSASSRKDDDSGAGWACLAVVLALALVVTALISLGALVDPFDWMPTVAEVWADCEDESGGSACDLDTRYPGFWGHLAVNLVYAAVAAILLIAFFGAVWEYLDGRRRRYTDADGAAAFAAARRSMLIAAPLLAATALLPMAVQVL